MEEEFWKVDFDASRVIIFLTETDVEDSISNDNNDDNDSEAEKESFVYLEEKFYFLIRKIRIFFVIFCHALQVFFV